MADTSSNPGFVQVFKGIILVKAARKWENYYKQHLPLTSIKPLSLFEEILDENFPAHRCESLTHLSRGLRDGGFTIPFLKRMDKHFAYVADETRTPPSLPLQLSPREWAQHFLVDCYKGSTIDGNLPHRPRPTPTDSPDDSSTSPQSKFRISALDETYDETRVSTEPRPPLFVATETLKSISEPMTDERSLIEASHNISSFRGSAVSGQRRTAGGKNSGKPGSRKPGVSSSSVKSSSSSTTQSSSSNSGNKPTFITVKETKAQYLKNEEMDDSDKTLIWKGVGDYYVNLFQQRGRWEREFARVSGDLSTGTAVYYTSSKRYALAYGAYKLTPVTWQKNTIAGARIFEAVLTDTNLSIVHLDHSDDMQWMSNNFATVPPSTLSRTPPPGYTKADWDIVYRPLKTEDIVGQRQIYEVLGLDQETLTTVEQAAFCTDSSVAYLSACHSRMITITDECLV